MSCPVTVQGPLPRSDFVYVCIANALAFELVASLFLQSCAFLSLLTFSLWDVERGKGQATCWAEGGGCKLVTLMSKRESQQSGFFYEKATQNVDF